MQGKVYKIWKRMVRTETPAYGLNVPRAVAESFDGDARFAVVREGNRIVYTQVELREVE